MAPGQLEPILIERFPREGSAHGVEVAVQTILEQPAQIDALLAPFQAADAPPPTTNQGIIRAYRLSQDYRQTVYGALSFLTAARAFPEINQTFQANGTLVPGDAGSFNVLQRINILGLEAEALPAPLLEAVQAGYWLGSNAQSLLRDISEPSHPFHPLYEHLYRMAAEYQTATLRWKEGPGKNRWPYKFNFDKDPETQLVNALCVNTHTGIDMVAGRAVNHLIHRNARADAAELARVVHRDLGRIGWMASVERHMGWKSVAEQNMRGILPGDSVSALLQVPVSRIVEPNDFRASVNGVITMRSPDFCPHPAIASGPLARAAHCGADITASYPDEADRASAREFFGLMALAPENGDEFNLASVVLAMGSSLLRTAILPVYEANRLQTAAD